MADDQVNMHKRLAMGADSGITKAAGKGIKGYKAGGKVMPESQTRTLILDSSQKQPLPKPGGKIASLKKGGDVSKKGPGLTIAVAIPMRKAGRGR
jgi:hypothetical protein